LRQTASREKEKVKDKSIGGEHWRSESCKLFRSMFQMLATHLSWDR